MILVINALIIMSPLRKYKQPKNEAISVKIMPIPCNIDFIIVCDLIIEVI